MDQWRGLQASATTGQEVGARLKGKQGVMVGRKRLGDDGITWPEGGNINMMHGDSRVMVVVCLGKCEQVSHEQKMKILVI
ncbi:hypothetical protein [Aeromonas caviae]|uniref:hypothetical protein n=1 Tax=Aeromonas caviae TaxID=648 RepID=UPI00403F7311